MFHQNESIFPGSSIVRPLGAIVVKDASCALVQESRSGRFSGALTRLGKIHPGNWLLAGFAGGGGAGTGAGGGAGKGGTWLALATDLSLIGS